MKLTENQFLLEIQQVPFNFQRYASMLFSLLFGIVLDFTVHSIGSIGSPVLDKNCQLNPEIGFTLQS